MKVNGSGSMTCRGTDRHGVKIWTLRATLRNGQRPSRTFHGSKTAARRALNEWIKDLEDGMRPDADGVTFAEYADAWEANRATLQAVRPATLRRDALVIRRLRVRVGCMRLQDIDAATVKRLYADMTADGMSPQEVHRTHVKLKQVLRSAVDDDMILRNPCDRVRVPQPKPQDERRSLDRIEAALLVAALDGYGDADACATGVRLALATGMRLGEVLGLVWGNVSLSDGFIDVVQALTAQDGIQPPKSAAGRRRIAIDAATAEHLRRWKDNQAATLRAIWTRADGSFDAAGWASFWKDDGAGVPVVSNMRGGFYGKANYERWFRRFCVSNGFGAWYDGDGNRARHGHYRGLRFHELRHTQATLLIADGVDVKTVQHRLGHENVSTTLDLYAHATHENDMKAAGIIGGLLDPGNVHAGDAVAI